MNRIATETRGLGFLISLNSERLLYAVMTVAAMALIALVGVEYANSIVVENHLTIIG